MSALTVGSLFSGIGGLELGLERTGGFRTAWQCERDPWARGVLERHWPGVARYEDVLALPADLPPVDVVCGGFPCQDISNAGKRAGLAGERSGLWGRGFVPVLQRLRPRYVVVENVAALLARGFPTVLGDLAALGYDAEWAVLRASDVGAPHRRARLFILAYHHGERRQEVERRGGPRGRAEPHHLGEDVADTPGGGLEGRAIPEGQRDPRPGAAHADRTCEGVADAGGGGRQPPKRIVHAGQPDAPRVGALDVGDAERERGERRGEPRVVDRAQPTPHGAGDAPARGSTHGPGRAPVGDAHGAGLEGLRGPVGGEAARPDARRAGLPDWPPGPSDADGWARVLEVDAGVEPAVRRVAHGLPRRVDRLRGLGNAVVPQVAEVVARRILQLERGDAP